MDIRRSYILIPVFILCALILIVSIGCSKKQKMEDVQSPQQTQMIVEKIAQVKRELRSTATAIEAYAIDYNKYPASLNVLTTPIDYISKVYPDPFSPTGEPYKLILKGNDWTLYSIGPDGMDDKAAIIYTHVDGRIDEGDIVRNMKEGYKGPDISDHVIRVPDTPQPGMDTDIRPPMAFGPEGGNKQNAENSMKLSQTYTDMRSITTAIEAYFVDNSVYPPARKNLTTPIAYLYKFPVDPFSPTGNKYILETDSYKDWRVYSVGPDGKDDGGEIIYNSPEGSPAPGDIVTTKNEGFKSAIWNNSTTGKPYPGYSEIDIIQLERNRNRSDQVQKVSETEIRRDMGAFGTAESQKLQQTYKEMRMIRTAIEAYLVDWSHPPLKTSSLTTPIAYLTRFPDDPYAPVKTPYTLIANSYTDCKVYSFGPNGLDEKGEVIYQRTDGKPGPGDMVWTGKGYHGPDVILQPKTEYSPAPKTKTYKNRLVQAKAELRILNVGLQSFMVDYNRLPDSFNKLTTPIGYISTIYPDPFRNGEPYSYIQKEGRGAFVIYSFGPDGDDDKGEVEYTGDTVDPSIDGDIIFDFKGF